MRSTDRPYRPGPEQLRVLRCVAAGFVVRGDLNGTRQGMWQTYELHGEDVGMIVRSLGRAELVDTPLIGPPRVSANGWRVLRDASTCPLDKTRPTGSILYVLYHGEDYLDAGGSVVRHPHRMSWDAASRAIRTHREACEVADEAAAGHQSETPASVA